MTLSIEQENETNRFRIILLLSGVIFFTIHFILSWCWFKERMLQYDTPFYVLKLVQQQNLTTEHDRFSTLLIQLIPYLVMKSGASLETITKSYSVAADVYYLFLFISSIFILKNLRGALLLLLFLCLALGRDYFLPVGEYQQAALTSTVLFGLPIDTSKDFKLRLCFAALIIIICLNFHPIGVFGVAFVLLYNFWESKKEERKYWFLLALVGIICFAIRARLSLLDDYENNKMGAWTNFRESFFHPGHLTILKALLNYFKDYFPQYIFIFFISAAILIRQHKFVLLVFHFVFVYVLITVFSTIIGKDESHLLFGGYFILVGLPILSPLVQTLSIQKNNYLPAAVMISAILLFLYQAQEIHALFKKRNDYVERVIYNGKKFPERRYIIDVKNYPHIMWGSTWTLPFQTLLLSSFDSPDSAMTCIAAPEINAYDSLLKTPEYFLGPEWFIDMFNFKDNTLRKQYFNLPEKGYRKLTTSQPNFSPSDSVFGSATVSLIPQEPIIYATKDSVLFTSLKINNTTDEIIPAIPDQINSTFLSYHMKDAAGNLIPGENLITPLEADVKGNILSGLNISVAGLQKGTYIVEADLLTENKRWWGINAPIKLIVK